MISFTSACAAPERRLPDAESRRAARKETNHNLRLILLAIRLQRPVKRLPAHLVAPERITRASLASEYLSEGNSRSSAAAYKMASRHLHYMDRLFGLDEADGGYVMARRFDRFRDMFEYWLDCLGEPGESDKRMHVMLNGLLAAIDNAFRSDPVCVSRLARQLQQKYGQKNIRDVRQPLEELFSEDTLSSYLVLYEDEDENYRIGREYDPLLLRWRSRKVVGDNDDISINLAMPGRIHAVFQDHVRHLGRREMTKAMRIAEAVKDSEVWMHPEGERVVPYIFYREGRDGPLVLTVYHLHKHQYEDIALMDIEDVPNRGGPGFVPFDMEPELWARFRQLAG